MYLRRKRINVVLDCCWHLALQRNLMTGPATDLNRISSRWWLKIKFSGSHRSRFSSCAAAGNKPRKWDKVWRWNSTYFLWRPSHNQVRSEWSLTARSLCSGFTAPALIIARGWNGIAEYCSFGIPKYIIPTGLEDWAGLDGLYGLY